MAYNARSPAVKRLMKEAQELSEPTELFHAQPLEDNLFEWHFTIRGPSDTDFADGIYHGRIILPTEYPMKPPNIMLLTPNGRFETNKKICLSISGYHPESWRPSWSIRTALLAIIGFMPTHGSGAIGSLDYPAEERKRLAKSSSSFNCSNCGETRSILLPLTEASSKDREEAKDLAKQIAFVDPSAEKPKSSSESPDSTPAVSPTVDATVTPISPSVTTPPPFSMSPPPGVMPMFTNMWPCPNPYALPVGQAVLPGNNGQPLSFIDWLTQVKGHSPVEPSRDPPVPSPPPPLTTPVTENIPEQVSSQPTPVVVDSDSRNNSQVNEPDEEVPMENLTRHRSPHVHAAPPMEYDSSSSTSEAGQIRSQPSRRHPRLMGILYVIMCLLAVLILRRCWQIVL